MLKRTLLAATVIVLVASSAATAFAAAWRASAAGSGTGKAGALTAPTSVLITGCTTTNKTSGRMSGSISLSWAVSTTAAVTGQVVFRGAGSPTTYTSVQTVANNTTASTSVSYSLLDPGTYTMGMAATGGSNWVSTIAGSSNTFVLTTSGTNGSCSKT